MFSSSNEFVKYYTTDKSFKKTVTKNVKHVLSTSLSVESVEACIESNHAALKAAKRRKHAKVKF